ncbi:MAG: 2-dehydropantoate 2-reductase [Chloroflexi bacterium]|nr:2-dehydropantoate 2-reductase [Chloroflexota bacterium]MCI0896984.1 2-dehydropantoate 2-reductase [Chloroflexota bacterium]MCI0900229.1 2-dehydropantoate 2-reductase [Chloroflexota bacterium]MCI0902798.1 2-dehydropantoate 2-reductase [Chloroflexota bacterium]
MRIAVMGAGGIGSCYGGLLARAGCDVTLIARGAHLRAIQQNGLHLDRQDESFTVQVPATDDPSEVGPVDLVLFTVKTYQNSEAIPFMKPLVGDDSAILTLQNGVESAEQIAQEHGSAKVLPGSAYAVAHVESPGVIMQQTPQARLVFGESDGSRSNRALAFQETFSSASITAELSDDTVKAIWSKFLFNAPGNSICAAARTAPGIFLDMPEGYASMRSAFQEVADIAQAKGINLGEGAVDQTLDWLSNFPPATKGSMQTDLEAGRPLELEAMVGAVGRIGRRVNVPTPINDLLYAILLPYKDGPPKDA